MDFTREPIIETIITPKDGCKLAVRSSKGAGQEEYFVEALEVVAFGHALFFRSLERPKSFLVPVSDYEVVEVREARLVLKNLGPDRSIKIGGGRESTGSKGSKEPIERVEVVQPQEETVVGAEAEKTGAESTEVRSEGGRLDKKRDRRRHYRKRRNGKEEASKEETVEISGVPPLEVDGKVSIPAPDEVVKHEEGEVVSQPTSSLLSSLLQPPPTLISETINRYRENALFKNAFFLTEEEQYKPHDKVQELLNEEDDFITPLKEPSYEESNEAEDELQEQLHAEENVSPLGDSSFEPSSSDSFYFTEQKEPISEETIPDHEGQEEEVGDFRRTVEEIQAEEVALPLYAEESLNGNNHDEEGFSLLQKENEFQIEEEPKDWEEYKHPKD